MTYQNFDSYDNQNQEFTPNELLYLEGVEKTVANEVKLITRDFSGNKLKNYINGLPNKGSLSSLQREILIGAMLGDGTLRKGENASNVNFKYELTIASSQLVFFMYFFFQEFVGTPVKICPRKNSNDSIWFRTYRLTELTHWYNIFYTLDALGNRVRAVPDQLEKWITRLSLAIWFMDDGEKAEDGYNIHTQCFTLADIRKLQQILGKKFHLEVTYHRDHRPKQGKTFYFLYIPKSNIPKFNALVEPFILPCMKYKLHNPRIEDEVSNLE
jgi:hypothetical protein